MCEPVTLGLIAAGVGAAGSVASSALASKPSAAAVTQTATSNDAADAKAAQALLNPLLNDASEPSLYATYGHASHVAGDEVHAGIAYADATFLSGHAADALDQLHRLLKRKDLDYYTRAQIDARIAEVTPIVLEIQRRRRQQGQGGDDASLQSRQSGLHFGACAGAACR